MNPYDRALLEAAEGKATAAMICAQRMQGHMVLHERWRAQTVWHVDFDNGSDLADGLTLATALKTWGQLYERLGEDYAPTEDVDIYLYGDNKPTDPIRTEGWTTNVPRGNVYVYPTPPNYALVQIRVHAMTPRVYYTGALTAVQVAAWQTNTPSVVTDANAKGENQTPPVLPPNDQTYWYNSTIDWNNQVRGNNHAEQRLRITSGPRANAVAFTSPGNLAAGNIVGSGANGAIRTSLWCIAVPFAYTANFATVGVTAVVPQVGDPFVVEDQQLLYIDNLVMKGNGDFGGSGIAFNGFRFRIVNGGDSQNTSNQPTFRSEGGSIAFVECSFDFVVQVGGDAYGAFIYFVNCNTIDGIVHTGRGVFCYVDAGNHHLSLTSSDGGLLLVDADAMMETGAIYAQRGGEVWLSSAQVWDLPGHSRKAGVMCVDGGTVRFFGNGSLYGMNRLWGIDQTGGGVVYTPGRAYAIAAVDGGRFLYNSSVANIQNLMTIAGHVQFFGIGRSWENGEKAVSIDPATMAPTTLRDTSKANLFATIAAGGFGGRAVDPQTHALIAPYTSLTQPTAPP